MFKDLKKFKEILRDIMYVLTFDQKAKCVFLFLLILAGSFLDTLGVALVLPFAQAIMAPQELAQNEYLSFVFDAFNITSDSGIILFTGLMLVAIYLIKNGVLVFFAYKRTSLRWNMQRELQTKMLSSYMSRPYSYYLDVNTGDVLNGLINDVNSLYTVIEYLFNMLSYIMTIAMIGIYLCISDFAMAASLMLVSGACFMFIALLFRKLLNGAGQRQRAANAESYKYAYQSINGIKEINVMRRNDFFLRKYDQSIKKTTAESIRFNFLNSCPRLIIEAVCLSGIIITICVRYMTGNADELFVAKIAVFIAAAMRMLPLVASITNVTNGLVYYWAGTRNTYENIRESEKYKEKQRDYITEKANDIDIDKLSDEDRNLKLSGLKWRYPGSERDVLNGLSLKVEYKKSVAIIGASGAGKTTISDIIMGLYMPQEGSVEFAGKDIYSMPDQWSKMVGYVPQTLFLIDDTIRANITFGIDAKDVDDKRVWDVVERAQLKTYVEQLPAGLDTIVGERGIKLSGGQRQRIAIARALYHDPEILILDEATSALDNDTEKAVMEAIDSLQGTKTMVIIAHRLSTIKNCDVIYEIKDGRAEIVNLEETVGR